MDRDTFCEHLRQSRILPEERWRDVAARFPGGAEAVAAALVAGGLLTSFQARHLLAGEPGRLTLGQYRLLDELGRGGMGQVYRAEHTLMGRVVAVKVIAAELVQKPLALEWFRREVRTLTHLHHPNVVMAYDANEAGGLHFLVMEYVEGENLDVRVKHAGPLPVAEACAVMREAALALQYAHELGLVHRDIKPANLLLPRTERSGGPRVKLVDFGLARLHTKAGSETLLLHSQAGFLGTPDYASPEQCRDIHSVDIRSDLYSLGCTFYFALAGRPPFDGETALEKLVQHVMNDPPPVQEFRPDVPPAVAAIVRRLLAKDPAQRFQTPAELAEALEQGVSAESPVPAAIPRPPCPGAADGAATPTRILDNTPVVRPERSSPAASVTAVLPGLAAPAPAPVADRPDSDWEVGDVIADLPAGPIGPSTSTPLPATQPSPSRTGPATLNALWQRWSAVIEGFALRGYHPIPSADYRTLYGQVLEACRARAVAAEPAAQPFFRQLEETVRPWLSPLTLSQTDREILEALLARCRHAQWEMDGGKMARRVPLGPVLALVLFVPLLIVLALDPAVRAALPDPEQADDWPVAAAAVLRAAWQALVTNPWAWLATGLPASALALAGVLARRRG